MKKSAPKKKKPLRKPKALKKASPKRTSKDRIDLPRVAQGAAIEFAHEVARSKKVNRRAVKKAAVETGKSVLQITGRQIAKRGLKSFSKKFLGRTASRVLNKVGGPIIDAAFEATAIALDPKLTKSQKQRRIATRAVVAVGIVGATLVVPQAVVAIEVGATVADLLTN